MNQVLSRYRSTSQNTFSDNGQFSYPWTNANQSIDIISTVVSDGFDPNSPLYYGQSTDLYTKLYKITSCPRPGIASHNPVGLTFHAPSAAPWSNEGASDAFLAIWDQTDNKVFTFYTYAAGVTLPACTGTASSPCSYSAPEYCGVSDWSTEAQGYNIDGSGDSLGNGGWATHNRGTEMINNGINHAQYLETDCTVENVFPATGKTFQCASTTNKPPEGALFFYDYTPTQLADIKSKVPLWQFELIQAMTVYGGYMGDTHGGPEGLPITRFEGPAAYNKAGIAYPVVIGYRDSRVLRPMAIMSFASTEQPAKSAS